MPRTNIPFRPMRFHPNRKRTTPRRPTNFDTSFSEDRPRKVNKFLVYRKYTDPNILAEHTRLPDGNILKKIKGRNRKEKQRLKKKQPVEGDVKPVINKMGPPKSDKTKPRQNQHIIFLSDSESENQEENPNTSNISADNSNIYKTSTVENSDDDDVIFVETPAPEIIEIEDTEPIPSPEKNPVERESSPDDFVDKAHVNLRSKYDVEPDPNDLQFAKPSSSTQVDMSESGSISSVSDVSATVGMHVFKLIDFPQEKVNLFDDDNLDKFRESITPKRLNKRNAEREKNDNLPTLSEIQGETTNRKERGVSVIKELVNNRAYELLSQKKPKKKRKPKDDSIEDPEDLLESGKKKKKKKAKKKDDEIEDQEESNKDTSEISVRTDLFEPNKKEKKKKSKKNLEEIFEENEENKFAEEGGEKRKKKRKNSEAFTEDTTELPTEENPENIEKKRKKHKKNLDVSTNEETEPIEENGEKKKKKAKRSPDEEQQPAEAENTTEKRKKKRTKSETEIEGQKDMSVLQDEVVGEEKKNEERQLTDVEMFGEKKKKKSKKTDNNLGEKDNEIDKDKSIIQDEDVQNLNEEKKKRKNRKHEMEIENTNIQKDTQSTNEENRTKSGVDDEQQLTDIESVPEKRKKKSKKNLEERDISVDSVNLKENVQDEENKRRKSVDKELADVEGVSEKRRKKNRRTENTEEKETEADKDNSTLQLEDSQTVSEEKKKRKTKHISETTLAENKDAEKYTEITVAENKEDKEIAEQLNVIEKQRETEDKKPEIVINSTGNSEQQSEEKSSSNLVNQKEPELEKMEQESNDKSGKVETGNEKIVDPEENLETNMVVEDNTECSRKRKTEASNNESSVLAIESKRKKIGEDKIDAPVVIPKFEDPECVPQVEVVENVSNDRVLIINKEIVNLQKNCEDTQENETSVNKEMTIESDVTVVPTPSCLTSNSPMLVVDNEGNVDMKLTDVYTAPTLNFPKVDFSNDIAVENFADKNPSWKTDPARFRAFNCSIINYTTPPESPLVVDEKNEEPQSEEIPVTTVENSSRIEVKQENNDEENNGSETIIEKESTEKEVNTEEVVVKIEETRETNRNEETIQSPVLPNEIKNIVKERENVNTVKRLCEFLEEVRDPNDVLKKVSLLKQAYTEKPVETSFSQPFVEISKDEDDVFSISSSGSSVILCEDDVQVIDIEDDITLANCNVEDKTTTASNVNSDSSEEEQDDSVIIVQGTPKRGNSTVVEKSTNKRGEDVQGAPKRGEVIELGKGASIQGEYGHSTPKVRTESLPSTSREIFSESGNPTRGLDKYEVEDVQETMSNNPRLWRIAAEDIHPIRLPNKGKRCIKCREIGHLAYNCPNSYKLPKCSLCGMEGHLDFKCPKRLCIQCGRKTPMMQNVCEYCKHYKNLTCGICNNRGHPKNKCPDMWRRYHLTVNHGPLVQGDIRKLKDRKNLWCCCCARSGHIESECDEAWKKSRNFQPLDPRIHFYEDIYRVPQPIANKDDFIQPNLDEVPQTPAKFLFNLDGASSSSTSSSSSCPTEKNPNPPVVPTSETTEVDPNEGILGLSPDFEVIDEVNESKQESSVVDSDRREFFLTGSVDDVRQFIEQEVNLLETSKFQIKDIHPRFFAFVEDDKLPESKWRFSGEKKRKFFKSLNMLLFGKLEVKCGLVQKDRLKKFLRDKPTVLSKENREALCYSWDYIFKSSLHKDVNYKFFLKMLRSRFGNQKWLY